MELRLQKGLKVVVQIDGSTYINSLEGRLFERVEDDKAFLMIKSEDGKKEVKIQIIKDANN